MFVCVHAHVFIDISEIVAHMHIIQINESFSGLGILHTYITQYGVHKLKGRIKLVHDIKFFMLINRLKP